MENLPAGGRHGRITIFANPLLDSFYWFGRRGARRGETLDLGLCHRICGQYPYELFGTPYRTKV